MAIIDTEAMQRLRQKIEEAAGLIKKRIEERRPLLIRHHADCDGYSGAIAVQRAALVQMEKVVKRESDLHYYLKRLPCKAPFYEYVDAVKDISSFLQDQVRFDRKKPLVIIIDNGSGNEDLLALKKLKLYDANILVIDHHPPAAENDRFIDMHLNPYLAGADSRITAGMLASEVASSLGEVADLELFAAVSGIADKSEGEEMDSYLKLAGAAGWSKEKLEKLALAIDYEASALGFLEGRYLIDDLMFGDSKLQEKTIVMLNTEIEKERSILKKAVEHYCRSEDKASFTLAEMDMALLSQRVSAGRAARILFDNMTKEGREAVIIVHSPDSATLRISKGLSIDVNQIIAALEKELPFAMVSGGGHAKAGTVRFSPGAKDDILASIRRHLG